MILKLPQRHMDNAQVNDRVDMISLLVDMGFDNVDPHSEEQVLFCIFHPDENTKSFSVNTTKKVFRCFSSVCGVKGSAISLYALWKQITFAQACQEIQYLPKRRSLEKLQQQLVKETQVLSVLKRLEILTEFTKSMPLLSSSLLFSHIGNRGISKETADRFDLRAYDPEIAKKIDPDLLFQAGISNVWRKPVYTNHPLLFPYYLGNTVVFLQGRQAENDPMKSKYLGNRGSINCLFNHGALAKRPDRVYITEGAIDALSLEQMGYSPAVGIVGVEGMKAEWLEDFRGIKDIWLAMDNDAAGDAAVMALSRLFSSSGATVRRFEFDKRFKDCNELLIS